MKNKLSFFILLVFLVTSSKLFSQWSGTNPLWTNSQVTIGSTTAIPTAKLTVDGAACGGIHALHVRQPFIGCTPGNNTGDIFRVDYESGMQYAPALNVSPSGLVGIGTYTPVTPLHVKGLGYIDGRLGIGVSFAITPLHVVGNGAIQGNFGIGTTNPLQALHIDNGSVRIDDGDLIITDNGITQFKVYGTGFVHAREILVDLQPIPDYVFSSNYKRMPLTELEVFITKNKHLPGIKSEAKYKEEGKIALTELSLNLLEKVEEQALYIIELNKKLEELTKRIEKLER